MSVRNNNWYNLNSTRAYPLSDAATGTADDGSQLPNDIVVDLTLRFPPEAGKYAYIGAVTVTKRLVTVLIMAANTPDGDGGFVPLASITLQKPVVPHVHYPLEARYPGVGGFIVFENTDAVYSGRFSTPAQSLIAPKCAGQDRNLPIPNIRKLGRDIGLTGLVTIKAGTDMEIVRESVLIGSTSTEALVLRLLDTPGRNVLADYIGPCGERPESRNCGQDAIESINEAVPDCNGNINFEFVNLTPAPYEDCGPGILLDQGIGLTDVCTAQEVQRFKGTPLCDPIVLPQHSVSLSSFPSISESDVSLSSEVITCASLPWCENFDLETAEFFKVKEGVFVFEFTDSPGESCPGGVDAFSSVMLSSGAVVFVSGSSCSFTSNTSEAFSSQGSTLSSSFVDITSSYSSLDSSFDSDYSSECTGCEEDSSFGYSFESWSSESAGGSDAPVVTLTPVLKPWHRHTVLCPGCVEESLSGASEALVPGTNDAIQRLTWSNGSGTLNTATVNAVQKIMLANTGSQSNGTPIANTGNWTMVVEGHETYSIAWSVTAAQLENALAYAGVFASVRSYKYDNTEATPLSSDDGFYRAGNYFLVTFDGLGWNGRTVGLASTGSNTITLSPSGPTQAVVASTQVAGASSTWTVTWNGNTSDPIAANVNATTLHDNLAANVYGFGNVTVTIPAGNFNNGSPRYAQLNFTGDLAGIAVALPTLTYSLNPADTVITASDVQVGGGAGSSETVIWHQHNVICIELFTSLTSDSSEGQLWPDHDTRLVQRTHYHTRLADMPGFAPVDCVWSEQVPTYLDNGTLEYDGMGGTLFSDGSTGGSLTPMTVGFTVAGNQIQSWARFTGIPLAHNQTVTSATLSGNFTGTSPGSLAFKIYGAVFSDPDRPTITSMTPVVPPYPPTTASVTAGVTETLLGITGMPFAADVTDIVNEILTNPTFDLGRVSGNPLLFYFFPDTSGGTLPGFHSVIDGTYQADGGPTAGTLTLTLTYDGGCVDSPNFGYDCYFWYDVHLEAHMHHYTKTVQEKEIVHVPGEAGSQVVKTSVEHCVPTSTRTVIPSTHLVAVPYVEHPAVSYAAISGASRNVSVWDACAYSSSLNMQLTADLQILGDLSKHNGGLVINYHLVTPLTNPHIEYFLVLLDQDSSSLRIYRYTGTGLVLVNTFSTSSIVRGDWYRMRVQISAFSPTQTIIQGSVRGVSNPAWPAVSFSTITSLLLPADGLYGVGTDRSHTRFSYFQIQELP